MIAELGTFFLILALLAAFVQVCFLAPKLRKHVAPLLPAACWLQSLCVTSAFTILILLRLNSDFSVINVSLHSNLSLPLLYKITGTWGNHEGSMVLWVLVLSAFGLALFKQEFLKQIAVSIQAALAAGVLLFILFTSNPFARQFPPPADGQALNPVLQDIALAMHPPLLYVGYVGFSIVFSLALAALITGRTGREFASLTRPWILVAWSALTVGIGLGSWWAYRELGWGGFWFWDPVENASLMPWLAGTALLHSAIVLEKRGQLAAWVILLSILTFGLSLLGTFLVRSGALTSVHSFASDPARGLFILIYMAVAIGGGLLLYVLRAPRIETAPRMTPNSREGMIVFNNLFFLSACAVVLLGTIYPLAAEWFSGEKLTVGAPYFNATFIPLMVLPLLFAGLAPLMPWKHAEIKKIVRKARPALLAGVGTAFLLLSVQRTHLAYGMLGLGLGIWLFTASLQWLAAGWKSVPRLYALSVFCAHGGAAILVLGLTGTGLWQQETESAIRAGDTIPFGSYEVTYENEVSLRGINYTARQGTVKITHGTSTVAMLYPEYRNYDLRNTATHEAAIHTLWGSDLYAVIGESNGVHTALRLYYNPLIQFVWLGCFMMGLAGIFALLHIRQKSESV